MAHFSSQTPEEENDSDELSMEDINTTKKAMVFDTFTVGKS